MDYLKEAFQKVKQDITFLKKEIDSLKVNLTENRKKIIEIYEFVMKINQKEDNFIQNISTDRQKNPTHSTLFSTDNKPFNGLKTQNIPFSTRNQGVSTDRQTDISTDRQTKNKENSMKDALEILDSLDNIKKEIRLKFKGITEQEFLVFSTIYQLDEEIGNSNYKLLAKRLNLTESSIRDYVGRLIKKGIPIDKNKINNKNIQLSISKNLKKIASLSTILHLREL